MNKIILYPWEENLKVEIVCNRDLTSDEVAELEFHLKHLRTSPRKLPTIYKLRRAFSVKGIIKSLTYKYVIL